MADRNSNISSVSKIACSPDTPLIRSVPFEEDTLTVVIDERNGKEYVLPKPIIELFGLKWAPQHRKLTTNQLFMGGITKMVIGSQQGAQETLLLERSLVHAWLLSISVDRIDPAYREKLLTYQKKCASVLDEYFSTGHVQRSDTQASPTTLMLEQMLVLSRRQDEHDHDLALLKAHHQEETTARQELEHRLEAIESRRPPTGKFYVEEWLRHTRKPYLPKSLLAAVKRGCLNRETPEPFRLDHEDFTRNYFSPYTLAAAYEEATRQLSFFAKEPRMRYGRGGV